MKEKDTAILKPGSDGASGETIRGKKTKRDAVRLRQTARTFTVALTVLGCLMFLVCGFGPLFQMKNPEAEGTIVLDFADLIYGCHASFWNKLGIAAPLGGLSTLMSVVLGIAGVGAAVIWCFCLVRAVLVGKRALQDQSVSFLPQRYLVPGMVAHTILAVALKGGFQISSSLNGRLGAGSVFALTVGTLLFTVLLALQFVQTERKERGERLAAMLPAVAKTVLLAVVLSGFAGAVYGNQATATSLMYPAFVISESGNAIFFSYLTVLFGYGLYGVAAFGLCQSLSGLFVANGAEEKRKKSDSSVFAWLSWLILGMAALTLLAVIGLKVSDAAGSNVLKALKITTRPFVAVLSAGLAILLDAVLYPRTEEDREEDEEEKTKQAEQNPNPETGEKNNPGPETEELSDAPEEETK